MIGSKQFLTVLLRRGEVDCEREQCITLSYQVVIPVCLFKEEIKESKGNNENVWTLFVRAKPGARQLIANACTSGK